MGLVENRERERTGRWVSIEERERSLRKLGVNPKHKFERKQISHKYFIQNSSLIIVDTIEPLYRLLQKLNQTQTPDF